MSWSRRGSCCWRARYLVAAVLLLCGCSAPSATQPAGEQARSAQAVLACSATGAESQDLVTELRQSVETGPLFQALSTSAVAASCAATAQSRRVALQYEFRDGSSLRVTRDPSIEYTEQVAQFNSQPTANPVDLLRQVERTAFSPDGCGIDWKKVARQAASDEPKTTDAIYRGDTCNCQAVVRSDAAERVVRLTFRSTC